MFWFCVLVATCSSSCVFLTDLRLSQCNYSFSHNYLSLAAADYGHVWILRNGCLNQMCGETPFDLRMGVPAHVTNFVGLSVTITETIVRQRLAPFTSPDKTLVTLNIGWICRHRIMSF
jgi:hypothetical protein